MKSILLDLSRHSELRALAGMVNALNAVAAPMGIEYFLMGAAARDLMVRYAHGIEGAPATEDADFAVMVGDWGAYEALRTGLLGRGDFVAGTGSARHRLIHLGMLLDIVPFGGVERPDRTFAWPPDNAEIFDCFGVSEALAASMRVLLPDGIILKVATIPALTILKISAWQDRKRSNPGRDAPDILLFMRCYMDCNNLPRAAAEHRDLFEADDYDHVEAGVRLLARDVLQLVDRSGAERVLEVLKNEVDPDGELLLVRQSGQETERARQLLEVFCRECKDIVRIRSAHGPEG